MPVLENLDELKALINDVVSDYTKHTQKKSVKLSLFHSHGATGTKRVADWLEKIEAIDNVDELHQAIIQYMSNKKMGNTNPHSFRTMLLHRLNNPEQTPEKIGDKAYNAALKTTSSKFKAIFETLIDKLLSYITDKEKNPARTVVEKFIPYDVVNVISSFQSQADKRTLLTDTEMASELLRLVMNGEQDEIKKRLKAAPYCLKCLFIKGAGTDPAGREFDNITPFEYALWSLDRHMWDMMKKQVEQLRGASGAQLWKKALKQYRGIQNQGVSYTFEGKEGTDKHHYNFAPLINALKTFINKIGKFTRTQLETYWCTVVGMAQRNTVAHVRDEYTRYDRHLGFEQVPTFNEKTLPRNNSYSLGESDEQKWWPEPSSASDVTSPVLGRDFGFVRWSHSGAHGMSGQPYIGHGVVLDLAAITALSKVRTEEFNLLGDQLLNLHKPEVVVAPRPGPLAG